MKRSLQLALLLSMAGCAAAGTGASDPFAGGGREDTVLLRVRNINFADARLYTIRRGASRQLLGSVGGKQDAEFTLDWEFSEPLRIEINLLAGPTCTTEELIVDPGDVLDLQIESVFNQSRFCR
jgi:hypothetical protein